MGNILLKIDDDANINDENINSIDGTFREEAAQKLTEICITLSSGEKIDSDKIIKSIEDYISKYERIIYSTISNYIFTNLNGKQIDYLQNNIERLCDYAISKYKNTTDENEITIKKNIIKIYDHINLAIYQYYNLKNNDREFKAKFGENIQPLKDGITDQLNGFEKSMTTQLISILGIFTAISFVVFGGISSASSVMSQATKLPTSQLVILSSIWGLGVCNLVYFLLYFMSKLSGIPIKTNLRRNANLFRRHPYIILMNYLLGSILLISIWAHLIYTIDGISWLKIFISRNKDFILITTILIIAIPIMVLLYILKKISDKKNDW